jgi:branched-chain amino acid transport system substrate-binding protein
MEDQRPEIQKYVAAYKKKYSGKEPSSLSALGYDSMMVLADALKRSGGKGGSDLRDAIAQTKDFPGVSGAITLNSLRNAEKGAVIMEVAGGKFKFKEAIPTL